MVRRNYIGTRPEVTLVVDELFSIHYFEYIKHFRGVGEFHDFWELVYVDCGHIQVTAGSEALPLHKGEVYFHMPNEYHRIISADAFSSVFIISFRTRSADARFFQRRKATLGKREQELIGQILQESALVFAGPQDIMDQPELRRREDAPYGGEQVIRMLLEQLLIRIIRGNRDAAAGVGAPRGEAAKAGGQHVVDAVLSILTQHLYERLTLEAVCQQIMFSKSHVEKLFRDSMGCGVIQYFVRLKIAEAKRLISEGRHSFTEISDMLRFNSVHYFSRTFKSLTGMNPSEYAQSVKSKGLL
jgi:AraC-like DNA-binding protein/quercetin dioxygenase-like cupin family protein